MYIPRYQHIGHCRTFDVEQHPVRKAQWRVLDSSQSALVHRIVAVLTTIVVLAASPTTIYLASIVAPVAVIEQDDDRESGGGASSSALDDSLGGSLHTEITTTVLIDGAWFGIVPRSTSRLWQRLHILYTVPFLHRGWSLPRALYLLNHCFLC